MATSEPTPAIRLTARRDLTWYARIQSGLLDLCPDDHPDLFGPLDQSRRRLLVIDNAVDAMYGPRILALLARYGIDHPDPLTIPGGEHSKTRATVEKIHDRMEAWGVPRFGEPVLLWGGGVIHDVGGYAAATYRRGVPYLCFGTTLVAAIDAMFALKVATNDRYKNRLGAYHPPLNAYADPAFFATLTHDQIRDGAGEIFKVAVALDAALFHLLEEHGARVVAEKFQGQDGPTLAILESSVAAMAAELSGNPYEVNPQRASYAGHNISPAMEPQLTHGAAVALDLVITTMISFRRGHLDQHYRDRIVSLARCLGLALWHNVLERPSELFRALVDTAQHRGGRHLVPAPAGAPGAVRYLDEITLVELERALSDLQRISLG
jgi:3-dehydroquinate synthetase